MKKAFAIALALAGAALMHVVTVAQQPMVAGPNVNIIGGPAKIVKNPDGTFQLLEGDPGQRQNEVSCFVDSRDPLDIGCAFNDYTPVEIAGLNDDGETGDAWIGQSVSTDGGFTWRKFMFPGYKQDGSPDGVASPLHGLDAAADPTWVSGPNGNSYLSAIAFNRAAVPSGTSGAQSDAVLFVQKYVNKNNVENILNPFTAVGPLVFFPANIGEQFPDKPWAGVAPNGDFHLVWATFYGGGNKPHSAIWRAVCPQGDLTKCTKMKISEGDHVLNGTILTFHPKNRWTDISYRRRKASQTRDTDAIMFIRCFNASSCTKPIVIASPPELKRSDGSLLGALFDQGSGSGIFRNISNPAIAVDANTSQVSTDAESRVYIAWAQRIQSTDSNLVTRDSKIMLTVGKSDKYGIIRSFSTPVAVDSLTTNPPQNPTNPPKSRGHEFRPQMWFAWGKLFLSAAILQEDQTLGVFNLEESDDPGKPGGKILKYVEKREPKGELIDPLSPPSNEQIGRAFTEFVYDRAPAQPTMDVAPDFNDPATPTLKRRHTEEIGLWTGTPALPGLALSPSTFTFTNVWRSRIGLRKSLEHPEGRYEAIDANPWGIDLFNLAGIAFAGDYDSVFAQAFIANAAGTGFSPNTSPSDTTPVYVAWTDNRNVRTYVSTQFFTPAGSPACVPGTDGFAALTRNQDIYIVRAGQGFYMYTFGNQKPINAFKRAFTVVFQNALNKTTHIRAVIVSPVGISASWKQFDGNVTQIDLSLPPFSMAAREVYAFSNDDSDATIRVNAFEITKPGPEGTQIAGGVQGFTIINPDRTTPDFMAPFPGNIDLTDPRDDEIFTPDPLSPDPLSSNVDVTPDPLSPDPLSPDPLSPDPLSPDPLSPDPLSPDPLSPDPLSPDPLSPDPLSPDPLSVPAGGVMTDTLVEVNNRSNTSAAIAIKTFATKDLPPGSRLQINVIQPYFTTTQRGCELKAENASPVLATISDPTLVKNVADLTFDPTDSSPKNLTVGVPPGGKFFVVYRWVDPIAADNVTFTDALGRTHSVDPNFDPAADLITVPIAEAVSTPVAKTCGIGLNPPCPTGGGTVAFPLRITTDSLLVAAIGRPYPPSAQAFSAEDGTAPYTWSVSALPGFSTALPVGLTLNSATGEISGTPTGPTGTFFFMVQVHDSSSPARTASRVLSIEVIQPVEITTLSLAELPATDGVAYAVTLQAINGVPFTNGTPHYSWSKIAGNLPPGLTLNTNTGVISGTPDVTQTGAFSFTVKASDQTPYSDTQNLCIHVSIPPPSAITTAALNAGGLSPTDLANTLVGPGSGITISNVTFNGSSGAVTSPAAGTFTGAAGIVGFNKGIILSSGYIADVPGPNNSDNVSQSLGTGSDADLEGLIPAEHNTLDKTVLEFDFVAGEEGDPAKTVTFQYVFASEEYNEFVNSQFNDVFGFFIDGVNVALLTGTSTPVSINTVNGGKPFGTGATNPAFYQNNDPNDPGPATINIQADGLTVVLTITKEVTAGTVHHMKLAIADAGDQALDSWVLIKAGSFKVDEICDNGIDDDNDGLVDSNDPDCHVCPIP